MRLIPPIPTESTQASPILCSLVCIWYAIYTEVYYTEHWFVFGMLYNTQVYYTEHKPKHENQGTWEWGLTANIVELLRAGFEYWVKLTAFTQWPDNSQC